MQINKINKARAGLVLDMPFFGSLALRLKVIEDKTCGTAWVNGQVLGYNPDWINSLTFEEVKGVLTHEVMHCAMGHPFRRGDRDHRQWNVACDYAINQILVDSGLVLTSGGLLADKYKGMASEQIYGLLGNKFKKQPETQGKGQSPDTANPDDADVGNMGETRDAVDPETGNKSDPAENKKQEENWKIATIQASTQANAMGNIPAGLEEIVKDLIDPEIDWKVLLQRFVKDTAKEDYSWTPPNRRYIHQGLYLPVCKSETIKDVIVAIDTSGSINQIALSQFISELSGILEDVRACCHVLFIDTKIQQKKFFTPEDLPLKITVRGRGGTSFKPAFTWIDNEGLDPACLIYFTDLECNDYPAVTPEYPVLWLSTSKGESYGLPSFGEVVYLN